MRGPLLASFLSAVLCLPSSAALTGLETIASFEEQMIPFFGQGFPTTPMAAGLNELKVVPASFQATKSEGPGKKFDVSGQGLAVSYLHAFSPHWGFGILGGVQNAKGDNTSVSETSPPVPGGPPTFSKTPQVKETSSVILATVVYDRYSDPEGFRLPLFFGVAYYNEVGKTDVEGTSVGTPFKGTVDRTVATLLPMFGVAAQFNTGKFRWTTFAILSTPFNADVESTLRDTSSGASLTREADKGSDHTIGGVGVELQYRPWKISTVFAPTFNSQTNFLSLKWTRTW